MLINPEPEPEPPIAENNDVTSDTIIGTTGDDTLVYGEGDRILIDDADLLANDSDPQGGELTITNVGGAVHGATSQEDGDIIFIGDTTFAADGSGAFNYIVANPEDGTAMATVTVLDTIPQVMDARGGNNTLQLNTEMTVDLGQTDDQTPNDTLTVLNFNNVIGSPGDDSLVGNDNDNRLIGSSGDDTVLGIDGNNTLVGGEGINLLFGGDGDDLIIAGTQDDVSGGDGTDTFMVDGDDDVVIAMPNDIEVLMTGEGDDSLIGTPGSDSIISAGGNNTLDGGGGGDFFAGGPGGDVIIATNGPDTFAFNEPTDGPDTLLDQGLLSGLLNFDDHVIMVSADSFGGGLTPGVLPSEKFTFGNSADGPEPQVPILVFRDMTLLDFGDTSIVIF